MKKYLYIFAAMFFGATVLTGCSDDDNATPVPGPTPAPESDVVDLGLPSGTLWASANLGAESRTETGNLYAWGETFTKSNFSESNYFDPTSTILTQNITGTSYDAAQAALGGEWVMPTQEQFDELFSECEVTLITEDKVVTALKLTGPNEKILYLPAVKADVEGAADMYDSYVDEKGVVKYVKYESVMASYWTGEIASSAPQNANQYAVQALYVEHAKDAVKKGGADQYGFVAFNRSRLAGAPIRPVKVSGGTPVAEYVDIAGKWAQCDAQGNLVPLEETPMYLAFEGTNYNGKGVAVNYGEVLENITYSRNINEIIVENEDGETSEATVADVTTTEDGLRVISITEGSNTIYFVETVEDPEVPVEDLAGKWNFTFDGGSYAMNIIDGKNIIVKNPDGENVSATYNYRFGTFDIDCNGFEGAFAVVPATAGACPFQFVGESTTVDFTARPAEYENLFSWNTDGQATALPSIFTHVNANNALMQNYTNTNDNKKVGKTDMMSIDGSYSYPLGLILNKSMNSSSIGKESTDKNNLANYCVKVAYKFKAGDRIRIRGYVNAGGKNGSFKVFDSKAIYLGKGTPNFANYNADEGAARKVNEVSFIFTEDVENVYIARDAGTGTFVCEFYIDRDKF